MGNWGNYNENYNRNSNSGYNRNSKPRKKTGCRTANDRHGNMYIYAWNNSKKGFLSMSAFPIVDKKTGEVESGVAEKSGRTWERWLVKCKVGYNEFLKSGFYYPDTRKLVIPEMGMVANPRTDYFGTFKRK